MRTQAEINITFCSRVELRWSNYGGHADYHCYTTKKQAEQVIESTSFLSAIGLGKDILFTVDSLEEPVITGHFMNPILEKVVEEFGEQALDHFNGYRYSDFVERFKKKLKKKKRAQSNWMSAQRVVIPDIGYKLKLVKDWGFGLKNEYRNALWDYLKPYANMPERILGQLGTLSHTVTIRAGAELTVDRVYIRKGSSDYSSITFYLINGALVNDGVQDIITNKKIRFFASLDDVNQIVCEWDEASFS